MLYEVLLPFDRNKLRKRNARDFDEELEAAERRPPEQGIVEALELSEVVRQLARATASAEHTAADLEEKARLYVLPLKAAQRL